MSLKCINKPYEGHQNRTKTTSSPYLGQVQIPAWLMCLVEMDTERGFLSPQPKDRDLIWALRTIEDVLGVKWDRRAGIPISFHHHSHLSLFRRKSRFQGHLYSNADVSFLLFGHQRSNMSCVSSGQFLHLPSPSWNNFVVKVLIVSKRNFFTPTNIYVFLAFGVP